MSRSICEIRDRAATILREAGYIAAVEVPEQRIADGDVRFQVLMAKLVGMRVRGDAGRSERTIARYLEQLTEQEVFNRYEAERYLLLAGDLPGYDVRLALRSAGAARGEVIGEVTVVRQPALARPHRPEFRLARARPLGRAAARPGLRPHRARRPHHARRSSAPPTRDEQQTLQVGHDFRIGGEGLAFGGQLTYAWASPDLDLPGVDIDSRTLFATLEASYPFIRRQARTLRGALGLDLIDQDIDFNDLPLNRDRLRVAFAAARFRRARPGRRAIRATRRPSRAGGWAPPPSCARGSTCSAPATAAGPGSSPASRPARCRRPGSRATRPRPCCAAALYGEYRPVPRLTFALGAARPMQRRSAAQLRGILGRQLHRRARLRSRHPARRQRHRRSRPSCATAASIPTGPTDFAVEPYVFFDQAWVWNEDRLFALPPPGIELGRRRRPRRLWRPLPARRPGRRAARPRRLPDPARRPPPARLAHHPPVAMEVQMTAHASSLDARLRRRHADRLRVGRLRLAASQVGAQAFNAHSEDGRRQRHLRPRHAGRRDDHRRHADARSSTGPRTSAATRSSSCPPATPRPSPTAPTTPISSSSTGS